MVVPAVVIGIILGPIAARFLDAERWGSAAEGQQEAITLVSIMDRNMTFCVGHEQLLTATFRAYVE